ncbi:MAG: hypothetical protein FJ279_09245 [Planctomycetes bacterium]|nr:hypothetical protein [Planctomycetota bacterium]
MNIGKLHVVLVHFPIALAFAAGLAEALWWWTRRDSFRQTGLYCLVLAALGAIPTVLTGLAPAEHGELTGDYVRIATVHRNWAITALVSSILAAGLGLWRGPRLTGRWLTAYWVLMAALLASITFAGHYGGVLVHGKDFLSNIF